jgi:hypothetical protein
MYFAWINDFDKPIKKRGRVIGYYDKPYHFKSFRVYYAWLKYPFEPKQELKLMIKRRELIRRKPQLKKFFYQEDFDLKKHIKEFRKIHKL